MSRRTILLSLDLGKLGSVTPAVQLRGGETIASVILQASPGHSIGSAVVTPDWTPCGIEWQADNRWCAYAQTLSTSSPSIERLSIASAAGVRFRCSRPDSGALPDPAARLHVAISGDDG